ncbi:MAG TPA: HlyD family efflux transporter periplasmic adaptor subunit [Gemmatimonadaceae bacterium]
MLLLVLALFVAGPIAWYKWSGPAGGAVEAAVMATVKEGSFHVTVTTTGELRARKFVQVTGPANAQMANVYQTKIASIVPEGQVVKAGEVIAELDKGPAAAKLADVTLNLQKAAAQYTSAQLDSALNLATAREDIRTAEYTLEEKKLAKEQAQYEAPTIKRQAEIDLEKAQRASEQSKVNYQTKLKQAVAKMAEVSADRDRQANQLKIIQDVMASFTIKAPAPGMVIYVREWNGKKKGVGSQWSPWDPTVATLPDLTQMESDTYVNEVDVRKVAVGQQVVISLDADPTKKLTGTVTSVANVGEQRPNQDSKVFEVKINIAASDTTLRPGMTTSNAIETASVANVLSVPLEAVTSEGGLSFVFKRDGSHVIKQQIETGVMNDNEIVVQRGLAKGDRVLLVPPADRASLKVALIPGLEPVPAPTTGGDTAKRVTLQAPPR